MVKLKSEVNYMEKICPLLDRKCIFAKCEMFEFEGCLIKQAGKLLFDINRGTAKILDIIDEPEFNEED